MHQRLDFFFFLDGVDVSILIFFDFGTSDKYIDNMLTVIIIYL